jgi:hypothetical protein
VSGGRLFGQGWSPSPVDFVLLRKAGDQANIRRTSYVGHARWPTDSTAAGPTATFPSAAYQGACRGSHRSMRRHSSRERSNHHAHREGAMSPAHGDVIKVLARGWVAARRRLAGDGRPAPGRSWPGRICSITACRSAFRPGSWSATVWACSERTWLEARPTASASFAAPTAVASRTQMMVGRRPWQARRWVAAPVAWATVGHR